jgi:hypothetical protein
MKRLMSGFAIFIVIACVASCRKTGFIETPDALLNISADTLHFDTVFTTTGSVSQAFKIFNPNDKKLRLSNARLVGGATSPFKLNVDGSPGTDFNDIEIAANDSIYVFVTVTINPNAANLPFIVRDSILINYNGNKRYVQLDAFGQNANFFRNKRARNGETWNNNLPYVILGSLTVDSSFTLNIQKGCRIYVHADAPIIINGSLKVNGEKYDSTRVVFQADRLDQPYRDFPAGWPGIYFSPSSKDNVLTYAVIKNAYQGIITQSAAAGSIKVTLNQCIINNIYDAGILSIGSSIKATNCLISNCGNNVAIASGGNYSFDHCTIASYANTYLAHKSPVLSISNANEQGQTSNLNAAFRNCIFFGEGGIVDNEITIDKKVTNSTSIIFQNVVYKLKDVPSNATFSNSANITSPEFDSIDIGKRHFDFHLKATSPAVKKGINISVPIDLDGKPRALLPANPDIGCYER